jgi:hypothetical protein
MFFLHFQFIQIKYHPLFLQVCLISVIPFLLAYLPKSFLPVNTYTEWVQSTINILGAFFDSLSFIAEEVCLILISAEFRRLIVAHLCQIFYGKSSIRKNVSSKNNAITMINVAPVLFTILIQI